MALKTAALDSSSEYQEQLNDLQGQLSASQAAEEAAATQLSTLRQQVSCQVAKRQLAPAPCQEPVNQSISRVNFVPLPVFKSTDGAMLVVGLAAKHPAV